MGRQELIHIEAEFAHMSNLLKNAIVLFVSLTLAPVPAGAIPQHPAIADGGDIVLVAKKKSKRKAVWHKTRHGEGQLLGRVVDIDRRARGRKLIGRVPARDRARNSEVFNQFMLQLAIGTVGAGAGMGAGGTRGCGLDVSTPNPTDCGTRRSRGGGDNGLRPPYQCIVNGRAVITNTFRAGCWMVRQNNTVIPMP